MTQLESVYTNSLHQVVISGALAGLGGLIFVVTTSTNAAVAIMAGVGGTNIWRWKPLKAPGNVLWIHETISATFIDTISI